MCFLILSLVLTIFPQRLQVKPGWSRMCVASTCLETSVLPTDVLPHAVHLQCLVSVLSIMPCICWSSSSKSAEENKVQFVCYILLYGLATCFQDFHVLCSFSICFLRLSLVFTTLEHNLQNCSVFKKCFASIWRRTSLFLPTMPHS